MSAIFFPGWKPKPEAVTTVPPSPMVGFKMSVGLGILKGAVAVTPVVAPWPMTMYEPGEAAAGTENVNAGLALGGPNAPLASVAATVPSSVCESGLEDGAHSQ